MQLGDNAIEPRDNLIRIYPQSNLFSHIIGQIDNENNGISGLEKSLDEQLKNCKQPIKEQYLLGKLLMVRALYNQLFH